MVVSFVRKTCETFEKKTGRTFENMVVFTKIVKFIHLVFHDFFSFACCSKCPVVLLSPCRSEVTIAVNSVETSRFPVVVVVDCDKRC